MPWGFDGTQIAKSASEKANEAIDTAVKGKKIYLPMVATYSEIATKYPNPEEGWTVVVENEKYEYRWDGTKWEKISVVLGGGTVFVYSDTPPLDTSVIWIKTSKSNV